MPKIEGLSLREQAFVDLLPQHNWIIVQAGVAAGFSEKYARHRLPARVLSKVKLKEAIDTKKANIAKKNELTREKVKEVYIALTDKYAKRATEETTGAIPADMRDCARIAKDANDALAKHVGFFEADNASRRPQIAIINTPAARLEQLEAERKLIESSEISDLALDEGG